MKNNTINLTITAMLVGAVAFAPSAFAGHHNNDNNHGKSYKRGHHGHNNNHHYNKHKRKSHHKAEHIIGGIIGGVVLGTIIHNSKHSNVSVQTNHYPRHRTHYRHANYNQYYSPSQPVVVNKTIVINNTPTQTYRVLNGRDCYLVNIDNNGNEILTQVPKVNCGF